eukprot:6178071-Pleurochrysis_carterae.AAC.4
MRVNSSEGFISALDVPAAVGSGGTSSSPINSATALVVFSLQVSTVSDSTVSSATGKSCRAASRGKVGGWKALNGKQTHPPSSSGGSLWIVRTRA